MNTPLDSFIKSLQANPAALARVNKTLPVIISILLILASSYTLSQITWLLIPQDPATSAPRSTPNTTNRSSVVSSNYNHVSNAHLFGKFQQTAPKPTAQNAPETKLNLVLRGILAATPMELATVIISQGKGGREDSYTIGDKVASASIKEIYSDRVILSRNGKLETLRMLKDYDDSLIQNTPSKHDNASNSSSPGQRLSDIRKDILKNPTSFGKYAIPMPYKENGKLRGYRLQAQSDRSLFDSVGLQDNDVILSVNGVELSNPAQGLKALRNLQTAKSVSVTILRDGAEIPLQVDIP